METDGLGRWLEHTNRSCVHGPTHACTSRKVESRMHAWDDAWTNCELTTCAEE